MRVYPRTLALLVLLLPAAGALAAQHRGLRPVDERPSSSDRSFWATVGISRGRESYRFDSDPAWSSYFEANSLLLSAGGRLSPNFDLGVEWNIWSSYAASSDQKLQALDLVGNWYIAGSPVFLKGGLGLGFNRIEDASGIFKDTGTGLTLGAGVDIPISRGVALEPRIDYYVQRYNSPGQANDYRERLAQIGIAVHFR